MNEPTTPVSADDVVSANVVLRGPTGQAPDPRAPVTATSLRAWTPDPAPPNAAAEAFRQAGFDVGEVVGGALAITAPAALFTRQFGSSLARTARGAVRVVAPGGPAASELPVERAPDAARRVVASISFADAPGYFG